MKKDIKEVFVKENIEEIQSKKKEIQKHENIIKNLKTEINGLGLDISKNLSECEPLIDICKGGKSVVYIANKDELLIDHYNGDGLSNQSISGIIGLLPVSDYKIISNDEINTKIRLIFD